MEISYAPMVDDDQNEVSPSTATEIPRGRGLSVWLASIFIVGGMAGSGVLALPRAIADSGWGGIALLIVCCVIALYSGLCLGRCWSILEERYEEYREKNRYPYPAIAERAVGKKMRYFVSFCNDINLFGVAVVFLLLSSQLIGTLAAASSGISFCYWIIILGAALCPLMWLGTPEDFWPAAVVALITTVTACVMVVVLLLKQDTSTTNTEYPAPTIMSFFLAYGTMLFAFGGAASFPTFQNDMRDKDKFPKAASIGFFILLAMYLPVAVLGYVVYGSSLPPNVLDALPDSFIKSAISLLLAVHMFFAFLLVINAAVQDVEEFLKIPRKFRWRRCFFRTSVMIAAVFIAQSIPRFGKVLNLVGASVAVLTCIIFPCLFYLLLCSQRDSTWPERTISTSEKICLAVIIVCGVLAGCIATYSAFTEIVQPGSFCPPCYVNITAASIF